MRLTFLARSTLAAAALAACLWAGSADRPAEHARAAFPGADGLIVFSSDVNGDREIFTMRADGGDAKKLTENAAADDAPAWSPDGTRIAFTTNRDGQDEIYVMNADGSNQVNVSRNAAKDQAPTWGPNGRKLAFHSDRDPGGLVRDLDHGGRRLVAGAAHRATRPSRTPTPRGRPTAPRSCSRPAAT